MPRPAPHVVSEEPRAAWTTPRQPLHDAKTVAPTIDPSLAAARVYSYKKADPGAESRFLPQLASDAAPPDEAAAPASGFADDAPRHRHNRAPAAAHAPTAQAPTSQARGTYFGARKPAHDDDAGSRPRPARRRLAKKKRAGGGGGGGSGGKVAHGCAARMLA